MGDHWSLLFIRLSHRTWIKNHLNCYAAAANCKRSPAPEHQVYKHIWLSTNPQSGVQETYRQVCWGIISHAAAQLRLPRSMKVHPTTLTRHFLNHNRLEGIQSRGEVLGARSLDPSLMSRSQD